MLRWADNKEKRVVSEAETAPARAPNVGLPAIFAAFFWLGLTSFGGGTAGWLHREIVLRRHWIDDATFLSAVALGRFMPGSGGVNLTVQVGQRLRGPMGAAAAAAGLLFAPLSVVLALAAGWEKVRGIGVMHAVLDGIGAAAIGLTFATGLSLTPRGSTAIGPLAVTLATVVAVGLLRWPMIPVVLGLLPVSIGLAALRERGGRRA